MDKAIGHGEGIMTAEQLALLELERLDPATRALLGLGGGSCGSVDS